MATRPKDITLTPEQGGRLVTARSLDGVGQFNYAAKVNFRRKEDGEGRREGWILHRPNTGIPQGTQALPGGAKMLLLAECVRPNQERALIAASSTAIYKFDYTTGTWATAFSGLTAGRRWQCIPLNGYLVLNSYPNLPLSIRVEDSVAYPIYELRENGIASVGYIEELNGIIQCYDVTEIQSASLNGVMNGGSPFGLVASNLCNRIAFRCIWGEIGLPRSWAPKFTVTQGSSSATITLPFASTAFVAGVTRVAVINGGPNGGVLGGQTGYESGILVTNVVGAVLTLEIPTTAGLSYPRSITVMRWEDQSTISGYYDLQDDASEIRWAKKLAHRVIIYRGSSIFRSTYTGSATQVFEFRRVVGTENVPIWGEAVADVNGMYHLYPGEGNRFYMFDGVNEPSPHKVCDDARTILFSGVTPASDVFAVDNPITKEIWFCRPNKVFAYDYDKDTASEIDAEIHAAGYIRRQGSSDRWFLLAINTTVFTYGLVESASTEILTFLRNGVAPSGSIKGGLAFWGDRYNEKDLSAYILHLSSGTAAAAIRVKLYATYDERVAPALILAEDFPGPTYFLTALFRAVFFQDEIIITETGDVDIRVTGRTFDRSPVRTQSIPRNNGT